MLFPSVTCGQTALWRPHCGVECVHVVDMAASCNICVSCTPNYKYVVLLCTNNVVHTIQCQINVTRFKTKIIVILQCCNLRMSVYTGKYVTQFIKMYTDESCIDTLSP